MLYNKNYLILVPSITQSLNHRAIALAVKTKPKDKSSPPKKKPWKYITAEQAIRNSVKLVTIGHLKILLFVFLL